MPVGRLDVELRSVAPHVGEFLAEGADDLVPLHFGHPVLEGDEEFFGGNPFHGLEDVFDPVGRPLGDVQVLAGCHRITLTAIQQTATMAAKPMSQWK